MTWSLENVSVEIGGQTVLREVSLEIEPGTVTAIVGGEGAGKTTLCRVLTGLVRPSSGDLRIPAAIGYQPASSGTWSDLTVRENLDFVADAHQLSRVERSERMSELIEATGMGTAIDRLAEHLSGGMRQKLGVAMALLPLPELAVLDEPTTGVDPVSRLELWQLLTRYVASRTTIVMSTTYLDEAERAETILALEAGVVLGSGNLAEIQQELHGALWLTTFRPDEKHQWRRRDGWRVWTPDGRRPRDSTPLEPDLNDVLTALTLATHGARP